MKSIVKKLIGDEQGRRLKKYWKTVDQINRLEAEFEALSDAELKAKTVEFKDRINKGEALDSVKAEAFAVVREASKRVLGLRHFDVQLIGGLTLNDNDIAEMATGEGKTLVASLPSYLRALEGKGVHVITVNDYLARRDKEIIGQVHEFLGLTVGLNLNSMEPGEKQAAYEADITYGVGSEFGFDYLRDNMVYKTNQRMRQRPYHFAIIDEVDSILIDEAKTPLIIAGKTSVPPNLYKVCSTMAKSFVEEEDYLYDREARSVSFTDDGITKVERAFGIDNLYDLEHQTLYHYIIQALRAHVMFSRDVEYIIQEGEVKLIDMFTGRVMDGRTLSDGLHQAIEAKEGVEITEENKTQATVTVQNYFRLYPNLSGMTGTAKTEETEFKMLYNMTVISIPTNRPRVRKDTPDKIFMTTEQKYEAMTKQVAALHKQGQPVLVGTTSIIQSETVSRYLDEADLSYNLLNAKSVEQEVELISNAGQRGQITIATNMAGRGTDIQLGDGVPELGGLYVLGTEKHEARRIDNQLRGRSGRQGDPGETCFFISIEDDMMKRFAREELAKWRASLTSDPETGEISDKEASEFIERVQKMCEDANYAAREYTLKLDDVVNEQRDVIYKLRNKVLESEAPLDLTYGMIEGAVKSFIDQYCPDYQLAEEWNLPQLNKHLNQVFINNSIFLNRKNVQEIDEVERVSGFLTKETINILRQFEDSPQVQGKAKQLLLMSIDVHWLSHLDKMNRLKEGIGLRSYQQEDPMRVFLREGFEVFENTFFNIQKDVSLQISRTVASR